jgi:hypothetical protein
LWNEGDGFYLRCAAYAGRGTVSAESGLDVGLIPLFAVETLEPKICNQLEGFNRRLDWFVENREDLTHNVACMHTPGEGVRRLMAIAGCEQLRRMILRVNGMEYRVDYEPGESCTGVFGGNSNWRGPIWFPVNFLLIESLQKFHHYLGDECKVECPTGCMMTLWEVAAGLSRRMTRILLKDPDGKRPVHANNRLYHEDPSCRSCSPVLVEQDQVLRRVVSATVELGDREKAR